MRGSPDRLGMTYEGLKMLGHLRRHGVPVYPFDEPGAGRVRAYEVNPSHTRARLGMEGPTGIQGFTAAFHGLEGQAVKLSVPPDTRIPPRSLDAVVACATLANAIRAFDLDHRWDAMPPNVTAREWEARKKEGLIVRLQPHPTCLAERAAWSFRGRRWHVAPGQTPRSARSKRRF